ncbi:MAG TPA: type II toxin-antitoxin system prevent-host-death family antitoxin [Anaerolineae bacterium]|nr:type II toxin-antitoxin system prevent-host-death family antitoxin [Anaerolineae bacterium]
MVAIQLKDVPIQFQPFIEAALIGEEIVITHSGKPIIKWVAIEQPKPRRQPGSAKQFNIQLADDFDEPLADFAEYMA